MLLRGGMFVCLMVFIRKFSDYIRGVTIKLGKCSLKVREFAIVFPFGLPRLGRAEDKNNKISRTFKVKISTVSIDNRLFSLLNQV